MKLKTKEINLIESTLANILDWDSANLEKDFSEFISKETSLSKSKAKKVLVNYLNICPVVRCSIKFDFKEFINSELEKK